MTGLVAALLITVCSLTAQEKSVAMVESRALSLADLDPPESWQAQHRTKLSEKDYTAWLARSRSDRLSGLIWAAVKKQFCSGKDCSPTEADIGAFQDATARLNEQRRLKDEARLREIEDSLATALPASEREKLAREKELLESVRSALLGVSPQLDRRIAEPWVASWKFYRALYRAYGGRVIFQQAGPEPLEAMTKLLREHEMRGTFAIYDSELHRNFWAYFTTMGHTFMPDGPKFLETPWWLQPQGKP